MEYKVGETFGEIKSKIQSGYSLGYALEKVDELHFRTLQEKRELFEADCDTEKLESMKALIDAKDSDAYDVVAYVAYCCKYNCSSATCRTGKICLNAAFVDYRQQDFIRFILDNYIVDGVGELAVVKMGGLVALRYNRIREAAAEFGSAKGIRGVFVGFQRYLYQSGSDISGL